MDVERPEFKGCSAREEAPLGLHIGFAESVCGEWVCKNLDRFFSAKSFEPPRVVHMLVGEKNPCERFCGRLQLGQQGAEAFGAEACIDQNRSSSRLGKDGISRAATGEDGDINHVCAILIKNAPALRVQDRRARQGLQWICGKDRAFGHEKFFLTSPRCQ